ncbi:hypothetical protein CFR78_03500 [Komagataeibacter rhaeticus]|uniref:hypothetical protein n=1 Tax=Komagataeibacter rhaeticus TaxID=215221 RepID=UPI0004D70907|nr:hypothetical protein [Komagataeibacter rhaeticus]KDU95828.1 hypothetical protein GLUCORHAEAF1_06935 [Komagataeibacter rhaeticus AF1]MBL7240158.1 hypothetical protein [Komagataeibacter rhaeticus]PYD54692.1 hypothetical protein CFR78_03500 [Komagataeibacter rhaeticus]GBQ16190.1 hypothetical protein AA16663_2321 [Komagataeibacter rhaeticus DSM 16663]
MGLPGIFVIFALIALLLETVAPRFHGIWETLLAFYCVFALVAGLIEVRLTLKAHAASGQRQG